MSTLQLQSTLVSPFKPFSACCFFLSLLFLSLLGLLFLSSPSPFPQFPKHSLISPPPHTADQCDLFKGKWVPDLMGPLYNNTSCLTLPDSYNCFKHGRNDAEFLNWRWKPDECDLTRFRPFAFLELVRGKTLAFVGDSVASNHMESLLCLLSQAETPLNVYKDTEGRFRTWNFPSSNFTLMVLWTQFLVKHEEQLINGSNSGTFNLHVDQINPAWASNLSDIDYLVISVGHWLFRKNYLFNETKIIGCVFCDNNEQQVRTVSVEEALRMVFRAALSYIDKCEECGDVLTVLRTFSPAHFENGPWNGGGYCNRTRPIGMEDWEGKGRFEMEMRRLQIEEVERVRREGSGKGKRFTGLDVTRAMLARPDGHPGEHWPGKMWTNGYDDCIHWCMPGPVDAWNDLLVAVLQRDQVYQSSSLVIH